MEAQGGASGPEPVKDIQKLAKPPSSGEVNAEPPHNPSGGEERGIPVPFAGLLQVAERRQPLSSVSSLEVHFDLLDLTELTDMSDQELTEVFVDSDEEHHSESPSPHHPALTRGGYMRSPSWSRCARGEAAREGKRQSESDNKEPIQQEEQRKQL